MEAIGEEDDEPRSKKETSWKSSSRCAFSRKERKAFRPNLLPGIENCSASTLHQEMNSTAKESLAQIFF
ncbi:unnamed protein product [Cuscuta campestris]|uniref:Uncharacterized protein n=1 Tax=Cuscuta campestris TaxID=132261 RepID=A0A484LMM6_9ASTE|nr:unnamed protein product [Cuscuta campestris]